MRDKTPAVMEYISELKLLWLICFSVEQQQSPRF